MDRLPKTMYSDTQMNIDSDLVSPQQPTADSLIRQLLSNERSNPPRGILRNQSQEGQDDTTLLCDLARNLVEEWLSPPLVENKDSPVFSSQIENTLRSLQEAFVRYPMIIGISPFPTTSQNHANLTLSGKSGFHLWLLSRLLAFLGIEQRQSFHSEAVATIEQLIMLTMRTWRTMMPFRTIAEDLMCLIEDLQQLLFLQIDNSIVDTEFPLELAILTNSEKLSRQYGQTNTYTLYISSTSACMSLLCYILQATTTIFHEGRTYLHDMFPRASNIWLQIMDNMIHFEDIEDGKLRVITFRSLARLISPPCSLPIPSFENLLEILRSHVYYFITDEDFRSTNPISLERALGDVFMNAIQQCPIPMFLLDTANMLIQLEGRMIKLSTIEMKRAVILVFEKLLQEKLLPASQKIFNIFKPWLTEPTLETELLRILKSGQQRKKLELPAQKMSGEKTGRVKRKAEVRIRANMDVEESGRKKPKVEKESVIDLDENSMDVDIDRSNLTELTESMRIEENISELIATDLNRELHSDFLHCSLARLQALTSEFESARSKPFPKSHLYEIDILIKAFWGFASQAPSYKDTIVNCLRKMWKRVLKFGILGGEDREEHMEWWQTVFEVSAHIIDVLSQAQDDQKYLFSIRCEIISFLFLPWLHKLSDPSFRYAHGLNESFVIIESSSGLVSANEQSSEFNIAHLVLSALDFELEATMLIRAWDVFYGLKKLEIFGGLCFDSLVEVIAIFGRCLGALRWLQELVLMSLKKEGTNLECVIGAWKILGRIYTVIQDDAWRASLMEAARVHEGDNPRILQVAAEATGKLACARAGTLVRLDSVGHIATTVSVGKWACLVCDTISSNVVSETKLFPDDWNSFLFLVLRQPEQEIRACFLRTTARILKHAELDRLKLETSTFGRALLKMMTSSVRELRILAGHSIVLFFKPNPEANHTPPALESNRLIIFQHIKDLLNPTGVNLQETEIDVQETLLLAVGQIGRDTDDSVLLAVLLCLVERLGTKNTVLRGVAFEQIQMISRWRNLRPEELFHPFLSELSRIVIDRLTSHPQILQTVSLILSLTPHDFLDKTLQFTLPDLIAGQKQEILQEIAGFLGKDAFQMCIDKAHNILVHLFMQDKNRVQDALMYFMSIASSGDIKSVSLIGLLKSCALWLVNSLVIELGDEEPQKRERALQALSVIETKLGTTMQRLNFSPENLLSAFLMQYILGILAHINESISERDGRKTAAQKKKVTRSLNELLKILGSNVHSVTPQIMATLQTVLELSQMRDIALDAWNTFVQSLSVESLPPLLNQIVLILLQVFPDATAPQRTKIKVILEELIWRDGGFLQPHFRNVATIPNYPELIEIQKILHERNNSLPFKDHLRQLLVRASHENSLISQQALMEMKGLLEINQSWIYQSVLAESVDPLVSDIIRTLLESCRKHNSTNITNQRFSAECLGIMGAVDPSRLDVSMKEEGFVMMSNFTDKEESISFACNAIEKQLVGAFRSTKDPTLQNHFSYAIQELLKFCGFTSDLLLQATDSQVANTYSSQIRNRWIKFPKSVLETISPLLESKYHVPPISLVPLNYPIYPIKSTFRDWLQSWAADLIGQVVGENAHRIFSVCLNIVRLDVNVALFMLPHLVLNILISGRDDQRDNILSEIISVLKDDARKHGVTHTQEVKQLCCQTVFSLVDHLTRWIRRKREKAAETKHKRGGRFVGLGEDIDSPSLKVVEDRLAKIPQNVMADASERCRAYARALMHFEQHIRLERKTKNEDALQPLYERLQRIYSNIDEPDGMEGITSRFRSRSLDQQILEDESAGKWTAAQTCYELSLQENPNNLEHHIGLIKCLKNLGHLETMLTHINGTSSRHPEWNIILNSFGAEASWRLGNWEALDNYLSRPVEQNFEVEMGRVLLSMRRNNEEQFLGHLRATRDTLLAPLAAASMESYRRAYDHILKLHMLYELEANYRIWKSNKADRCSIAMDQLLKDWDLRLEVTSPSFRVREPILNLRRIILSDLSIQCSNLQLECGRTWLQTAKLSRKASYSQTAYGAVLHATKLSAPFAYVERAKWLWAQGEGRKAMQELQGALTNTKPKPKPKSKLGHENIQESSHIKATDLELDMKSDSFMYGKATLLLTRWTERTGHSDSKTILNQYSQVATDLNKWEKSYYYLGQYYKTLYMNENSKPSPNKHQLSLLLDHVCKNYLRALLYGTRYIYKTMPRLLTLWLDFGALILNRTEIPPKLSATDKNASKQDEQLKSHLEQQILSEQIAEHNFIATNSRLQEFTDRLPAYQFLTAFPQIISRICHSNTIVFNVLEQIILSVLRIYPQQALWLMASVSKSTYHRRKNRCNDILSKVKSDPYSKSGSTLENLIQESQALTDMLLVLSNFDLEGVTTTLSIDKEFRNLQRMTPLNIIIPLQSALTPTLPTSTLTLTSHNPFPPDQVTIARFKDEVEIIPSLQRPRKIVIVGSDGLDYIFLCKPKDDLRKDARLMEFNGMINKLFKKNPESRRRQMHIRTYAVVPLNEECGLIEWVNGTTGLRYIISDIYKKKKLTNSTAELRNLLNMKDPPGAEIFTKKILPKYPPVLHEWFLEKFPEPTTWFAARLSFATTAANMSMVGYILGLGDRHGENILLDGSNGDCVHVDFNCLFEKGLTFDKPEKVPFRLTQNMVDAFGVTGYEGVFRKSCEISLGILRNNQESLMSVLETFIHDPLCEWSKKTPSTSSSTGEVENELAVKNSQAIERKLRGEMQVGLPLGVDGQVQELIRQATDPQNLFDMYIGWASYM